MDWFPIVFGTFKVVALSIGMFFAVKWHYDQGQKNTDKKMDKRAVLVATGKLTALFMLALLALGLLTFFLARHLGLDLGF
ncbi:hypothetical protein LK542_10565 [Massilia sp. IC2-477]|uniref:hypothetical protein n=1 Tax=unclassified Massilia TaxID=2609279 RepID=UPI001D10A449|nr:MULTISPECIES: hypothetical protein [unclassified Massilia]MCC2956056.1 hypothetical protein [Massilia sp. IC2-477]MCC2970640.1 hypothetical protein [Massilia sp. IC2-476]